jgi:hypothetical protein
MQLTQYMFLKQSTLSPGQSFLSTLCGHRVYPVMLQVFAGTPDLVLTCRHIVLPHDHDII